MKNKVFLLIGFLAISFLLAGGLCYSQDDVVNESTNIVEHTVVAGDNLHLLAAYYLYDARLWMKIYNINKENIQDPNILDIGVVLKIPLKDSNWKPKFPIEEWRENNVNKQI